MLVHTMHMLHFVIFKVVDIHRSGNTLLGGVSPGIDSEVRLQRETGDHSGETVGESGRAANPRDLGGLANEVTLSRARYH